MKEVYFSRFPGYYLSGDGARIDEDGDYWLMGRIDDVLNVSGHRLGTAEVESALVAHSSVSEAAVVGFPHDIKGDGIYAFVVLKEGKTDNEEMKKNCWNTLKVISPIRSLPTNFNSLRDCPRREAEKIMRRILRKIASGDVHDLGDISTLADPAVVESLVKQRL